MFGFCSVDFIVLLFFDQSGLCRLLISFALPIPISPFLCRCLFLSLQPSLSLYISVSLSVLKPWLQFNLGDTFLFTFPPAFRRKHKTSFIVFEWLGCWCRCSTHLLDDATSLVFGYSSQRHNSIVLLKLHLQNITMET